jgi:hypothetical protein
MVSNLWLKSGVTCIDMCGLLPDAALLGSGFPVSRASKVGLDSYYFTGGGYEIGVTGTSFFTSAIGWEGFT